MNSLIWRLSRLENVVHFALRLMLGQIVVIAGYQKLFVAGLPQVVRNFEGWHIPFPGLAAPSIAVFELAGGAMLILGLFTRYLGIMLTAQFVVALWAMIGEGGYPKSRLDSLILVVALLIATTGAGPYSLDAKLKLRNA